MIDSCSSPVDTFAGSGGLSRTGIAKPPSHRAAITIEMRMFRWASVGTFSTFTPMRPT